MASSISPLSFLNAYQSLTASSYTGPSGSSTSVAAPSEADAGASPTAELQALEKQGGLQQFLNSSLAAALLQPATGVNSGNVSSTLVNNMLQQVLGAYQTQTEGPG